MLMRTWRIVCTATCLLLAESMAAQIFQNPITWAQNPINGMVYSNPPTWPIGAQRSRFVYDPTLQTILYVARQTTCTHYTNSLWAYDLAANKFTLMTWSGSYANPRDCTGKPAENTPTYPSDRYNQSETY